MLKVLTFVLETETMYKKFKQAPNLLTVFNSLYDS